MLLMLLLLLVLLVPQLLAQLPLLPLLLPGRKLLVQLVLLSLLLWKLSSSLLHLMSALMAKVLLQLRLLKTRQRDILKELRHLPLKREIIKALHHPLHHLHMIMLTWSSIIAVQTIINHHWIWSSSLIMTVIVLPCYIVVPKYHTLFTIPIISSTKD